MKKLNRSGHISFVLMAIVVLAVIGGIGYWVWENQEDEKVTLSAPAEPCAGERYDSHMHNDDEDVIKRLPGLITGKGLGCAVVFTQMDITDIDTHLLTAREDYANMPGRVAVFYDVIKDDPNEVTRQRLDELWRKSGGRFSGLGEFAFYQEPLKETLVETGYWTTIFEFAAEKNIPVMIHPEAAMLDSLSRMLDRHPDTSVIVHGFEFPDKIPAMLKTHSNLYFTLDTAGILTSLSGPMPSPIMFPGGGPQGGFDTGEFLKTYNAEKVEMLKRAFDNWLPVVMASPDKVMWGTDIAFVGHVDDRVYDALMEATNEFLAKVPEKYKQAFLFGSAYKLIGAGVTLEPLTGAEMEQLDSYDPED